MSPEQTRGMMEFTFTKWAREYARKLKPEDIMESTPQATQREISLESLSLVRRDNPRVHVFNELLIQQKRKGRRKPLQIVPDNMVVLHDGPINAEGSYDIPLQPAGPFLVMEYVSRSSERKDYDSNVAIYEQELKVPYYLMFHPEIQELTLFRLEGERYVTVLPNEACRHAIPELELEVGILDGWMRYWLRGELLLLPPQLADELERTRGLLADARSDLARERRENADLRRQLAEMRAKLEGSA